jgi:hypothetical protein
MAGKAPGTSLLDIRIAFSVVSYSSVFWSCINVVLVVPAAGYIKSQAYVSLALARCVWNCGMMLALTLARSYAHFIDPALRAVMETSLTPDDNDLFLSNLHATPILAIHGGSDENVPTWHSREAFSILKTWNSSAAIL